MLLAAGCAPDGDDDMAARATAALDRPPAAATESARVYVRLESPFEACEDAGGARLDDYWLREVNETSGEGDSRRVTNLDVSALSQEALAQAAHAARGELLLQGTFAADVGFVGPFVVIGAWRGLPGVEAPPEDPLRRGRAGRRPPHCQRAQSGVGASSLRDSWPSRTRRAGSTNRGSRRVCSSMALLSPDSSTGGRSTPIRCSYVSPTSSGLARPTRSAAATRRRPSNATRTAAWSPPGAPTPDRARCTLPSAISDTSSSGGRRSLAGVPRSPATPRF